MGFFDFLKRKPTPQKAKEPTISKEDIFRDIFAKMAEQSPSQRFVQGSVFDLVRQNHDRFAHAVISNDLRFLQSFFIKGYGLYLDNPSALGAIPAMVNKNNNDTNPMAWNMSVFPLNNGDSAFLCFMPVQDNATEARIFSVIIGSRGDGYYYCMLSKDITQPSEVIRNKAMAGIETIGFVNGRGFELMDNFLERIKMNYYA